MKQNKFTQTEFHSLGITISEYNLIKKFALGSEMTLRLHKAIKAGIKIHDLLDKEILQKYLTKQEIRMSILNRIQLPYKDIKLEQLHFTKTGSNIKDSNEIIKNITKIKNKPIILNIYSNIGDQALMCSSHITEQLIQSGLNPRITSGIELNKISIDFESSKDVDLLDKDFLVINSINSLYATDYRKSYIKNLYEEAKLKKIPIILSSNVELINPNFKILNIRLNDLKKTHEEVLKEFLES